MAFLEVSELLYDPDFCDYFTFYRNTSSVNDFGETQIVSVAMQGYGSIQPLSRSTLEIFPELQRTAGMLEVYTTTALTEATTTNLIADTVTWNNSVYMVTAIADDFSNWGPGYFVAVLTKTDLLDADPSAIPHTEVVPDV